MHAERTGQRCDAAEDTGARAPQCSGKGHKRYETLDLHLCAG